MGVFLKILSFYLIFINLVAFIMMGYDKHNAKKGKWRVPESRIFLAAAIGGSIGVWLGMQQLHHKTLHLKFKYGIPAIFIVQILLIVLLAIRPYL